MLVNIPTQENTINRNTVLKFRDLSKLCSILCTLIKLSEIFDIHEDILYYNLNTHHFEWTGDLNNKFYIQIEQEFNSLFILYFVDFTVSALSTNPNWEYVGQKEMEYKFNTKNITRDNIQEFKNITLKEIEVINGQ